MLLISFVLLSILAFFPVYLLFNIGGIITFTIIIASIAVLFLGTKFLAQKNVPLFKKLNRVFS